MSPTDWLINLPKTKIFRKYLRSTLFVSVLPILILAVISLIFMAAINYNNTILSQKTVLDGRVQRVNLYVENKVRDAIAVANDPKMADFYLSMAQAFKSGIESELYRKTHGSFFADIRNMVDDNGFYDGMLIDLKGNIIATRKQEPDLGQNIIGGSLKASQLSAAFTEALRTGNAVISNFEHYEPSGMYSMFVLVPVKKSGKTTAVLAMQFENEDINSLTEDTGVPEQTTEILAGIKDGNNIIFINKLKRDKRAAFVRTVTIGGKLGRPIQNAVEGKTGAGVGSDYYGKSVAAAWTYIPALQWGIVCKKDMREVMQPVLSLGLIYFIIGLFMIFISVLSAVRLSEKITTPVITIAKAAKKVASGSLTERVDVKTGDEIEDLALDFNAMAARLEEDIGRLEESEERFRSAFEQAAVGMVYCTPEGRFSRVNSLFCSMTGYTEDEIMKLNFRDITYPDDVQGYVEFAEKLISGEMDSYKHEKRYVKKSGEVFWIRLFTTMIRNPDRSPKHFMGVVEDISAKKKAEEELNAVVEELKRSNSDLEQFAYISSHDLQEPLRSIAGYLQLFDKKYRGKFDNDADSYINSTIAAAERMRDIINDVLQYSRISKKNEPFSEVDVNEAVAQACLNTRDTIESGGAVIIYSGLPRVYGDFGQIARLFQNFISNSVKFRGKEPPRIEITARENSKDYIFKVKDNGIGIEPQYAEKVFAIFQRLHSRREYPGTGIGLAVCKKIVERHGGRIWLESEPEKGAEFCFTIPKRRV